MKHVHQRSFWIGMFSAQLAYSLVLLSVTWWSLLGVAITGFMVWANWSLLQLEASEPAAGVKASEPSAAGETSKVRT